MRVLWTTEDLQVSSSAKYLKKHTAKNSQWKRPIDKHPKELHSKQAKKASKDFGKHKADRRVCVWEREKPYQKVPWLCVFLREEQAGCELWEWCCRLSLTPILENRNACKALLPVAWLLSLLLAPPLVLVAAATLLLLLLRLLFRLLPWHQKPGKQKTTTTTTDPPKRRNKPSHQYPPTRMQFSELGTHLGQSFLLQLSSSSVAYDDQASTEAKTHKGNPTPTANGWAQIHWISFPSFKERTIDRSSSSSLSLSLKIVSLSLFLTSSILSCLGFVLGFVLSGLGLGVCVLFVGVFSILVSRWVHVICRAEALETGCRWPPAICLIHSGMKDGLPHNGKILKACNQSKALFENSSFPFRCPASKTPVLFSSICAANEICRHESCNLYIPDRRLDWILLGFVPFEYRCWMSRF